MQVWENEKCVFYKITRWQKPQSARLLANHARAVFFTYFRLFYKYNKQNNTCIQHVCWKYELYFSCWQRYPVNWTFEINSIFPNSHVLFSTYYTCNWFIANQKNYCKIPYFKEVFLRTCAWERVWCNSATVDQGWLEPVVTGYNRVLIF